MPTTFLIEKYKDKFLAASRVSVRFCHNTSIHGLKNIVEENTNWLQRIVWVLIFIAGMGFSSYFCWKMWWKWEESPVLMSIDSTRFPLGNISFPAVTICNVNKVSKTRLLNVLKQKRFENVSYAVMQSTLMYMTKLDRAIDRERELKSLSRFYQEANITSKDLFQVLQDTAPTCQDIVMDCTWLGLPKPCKEYFSSLPTDDGICCTFNGAHYRDSVLSIQSSRRKPVKVSGNGYRRGLTVVLNTAIDDYSVTNGKFDGFKILLHSPEEFADVNDRGFVIGPGLETFVGVKVIMSFNTEEVAHEVSSIKRKCYADNEHPLLNHPLYSRSGCMMECAKKIMTERCLCRPYFFRASKEVKLCDLESYSCVSRVYEEVTNMGDTLCNQCLSSCSDVWYEPEISSAPFPGRGFNLTRTFQRMVAHFNLSVDLKVDEYIKSNVATLHVYYKEKTGLRYKTDIRFEVEDFVSAMGGLLGLGLGMSFISIIELIYYLIKNFIILCCHSSPTIDQEVPTILVLNNNGNKRTIHPNSVNATNTYLPSSSVVTLSYIELDEFKPKIVHAK